LLDDEIVQEIHADLLSDVPSDCESDKSSNDDDEDYDFGPSASQKGSKRARLEVSDLAVNICDEGDDVVNDCWIQIVILYCSITLRFSLSISSTFSRATLMFCKTY
jgi:hypothetical protein